MDHLNVAIGNLAYAVNYLMQADLKLRVVIARDANPFKGNDLGKFDGTNVTEFLRNYKARAEFYN